MTVPDLVRFCLLRIFSRMSFLKFSQNQILRSWLRVSQRISKHLEPLLHGTPKVSRCGDGEHWAWADTSLTIARREARNARSRGSIERGSRGLKGSIERLERRLERLDPREARKARSRGSRGSRGSKSLIERLEAQKRPDREAREA